MKNYALITKGIEDLLVESYEKNDKGTINALLKELKSNPKLKTLYAIVDNLKNGEVPVRKIDAFINENIRMAKAIDFSEFDKLIKEEREEEKSELIECIGVLLFKDKTASTISEHYRASLFVKNHLIEVNTWEEDYKTKLAEYSKKYVKMDTADKALFESFIKTKSVDREELFNNLVSECITVIEGQIAGDVTLADKVRLYEAKDRVSSIEYNKEDYADKMVKIHLLKKGLI